MPAKLFGNRESDNKAVPIEQGPCEIMALWFSLRRADKPIPHEIYMKETEQRAAQARHKFFEETASLFSSRPWGKGGQEDWERAQNKKRGDR